MKAKIAIIGGSGIYESGILDGVKVLEADTPYGKTSGPLEVGTFADFPVAFLPRHGKGHALPAHRIPHKANLWALKQLSVQAVVGTSSVGSLDRDIKPKTFMVPHDFISPWEVPTYFDDKVVHVTPGFDEDLRKRLFYRIQALDLPVKGRGVYLQTRGPRLETPAEISMMKNYADVVGMTVASEATLATELQLPYAAVCSVDNYCNGIIDEPLTYEQIAKVQGENAEALRRIIEGFLGGWR